MMTGETGTVVKLRVIIFIYSDLLFTVFKKRFHLIGFHLFQLIYILYKFELFQNEKNCNSIQGVKYIRLDNLAMDRPTLFFLLNYCLIITPRKTIFPNYGFFFHRIQTYIFHNENINN